MINWIQTRLDIATSVTIPGEGLSAERHDRMRGERTGFVLALINAQNQFRAFPDNFQAWLDHELNNPVNFQPSTLFNTNFLRGHNIGYQKALNECRTRLTHELDWAETRARLHRDF